MERIFGTLQIRAVDEEQRIVEGVASTNALDDYETILEPKGARFSLPLPLLWQHRGDTPVGEVISAEVTDTQIKVRAKLARIAEPGTLKDDVDRAWQAVKHGLVKGFSVGFRASKTAGGSSRKDPLRFTEWVWRELSLVTLPANSEATIQAVRSAYLAASGDPASPGVPGTPQPENPTPRRSMNIAEQIRQYEATRAAKVAAQQQLMAAADESGETLDEAQAQEFDELTDEIRSIDGHLKRLAQLKKLNEEAASAVDGSSVRAASQSRGGADTEVQNRGGVPVVRVTTNEEPGLGFARYVMSLAACRGNRFEAAQYAKETWGERGDGVALMHRASVAAGTTTNATFAAPLVETNYLNEFLEMLRPATLIGRIPGLRRVPFNVSMPAQTAGGTYQWVGEGASKPVTNAAFSSVTLGMAKAAGIIVLTEELVRSSAPSAQEVVRNELVDGMQRFLDKQLVDPAVAEVSGVSPASLTNGVTGTAASGTGESNARADLRALIKRFTTNNMGLGGLVLLMAEDVAFTLGTMVNAVGERAFPGITSNGGNILGIPVVTSNTLGTDIVAVHAPSVLFADDGGTRIDISREASLIMDSDPGSVEQGADAPPVTRSLWQDNLVGLRAERWINWGKARSGAVDRIHTVAYA